LTNIFTIGADVSGWEGPIDWHTAARWLPFAYYKCTQGSNFVDGQFLLNKYGCDELGIPHSCYHYYMPDHDPIQQAVHFVTTAGAGYKKLIVDVEQEPTVKEYFQINLKKFIAKTKELSGCDVAIYTSAGKWNEFTSYSYPSWVRGMSLLVAHYTVNKNPTFPNGFEDWDIWQFSKFFYFPGCSECADGNWFKGPLDQCRSWFGNYRQVDPPIYNHTRCRSHFDNLHIRQSPNRHSEELGHLSKGEIVEVEDLGGEDVWIRHARGWTCVEQKDYRYMEVLK
jgi:lysozyme